MKSEFCFEVYFPGDSSAGFPPYSDEITVVVGSGDPGGEAGDFESTLIDALSGWYDGARVTLRADSGKKCAPASAEQKCACGSKWAHCKKEFGAPSDPSKDYCLNRAHGGLNCGHSRACHKEDGKQ